MQHQISPAACPNVHLSAPRSSLEPWFSSPAPDVIVPGSKRCISPNVLSVYVAIVLGCCRGQALVALRLAFRINTSQWRLLRSLPTGLQLFCPSSCDIYFLLKTHIIALLYSPPHYPFTVFKIEYFTLHCISPAFLESFSLCSSFPSSIPPCHCAWGLSSSLCTPPTSGGSTHTFISSPFSAWKRSDISET